LKNRSDLILTTDNPVVLRQWTVRIAASQTHAAAIWNGPATVTRSASNALTNTNRCCPQCERRKRRSRRNFQNDTSLVESLCTRTEPNLLGPQCAIAKRQDSPCQLTPFQFLRATWLAILGSLMKWEFPRLCRGGSQTLRIPGVYLPLLPSFLPKPVASRARAVAVAFAFHRLRSGPFEGPATVKPPALAENTY